MGMKKIKEEIGKLTIKAYSQGFNDGWDESDQLAGTAFDDGVKAERERIINMLKMLSEQEMETGSPNKAKSYRNVIDLIRIADMDFSEVDNDEY